MFRRTVFCAGLLMTALPGLSLAAGVSLNKTRVIFSDGERAESLGVKNGSASPWLVQVQVQNAHGQADRTMVATPPLFRLEANSQNNLRILSVDNGAGFPADQESLRYVQVAAIPASSQGPDTASQLAVAMGFRIKLFWRPSGLPEPGKKAWQNVTYTRQGDGLQACNGSPYYLSLNRLVIDDKHIDLNREPSMLAPFGCVRYPAAPAGKKIHWSVIDDYGGDSGWFDAGVT